MDCLVFSENVQSHCKIEIYIYIDVCTAALCGRQYLLTIPKPSERYANRHWRWTWKRLRYRVVYIHERCHSMFVLATKKKCTKREANCGWMKCTQCATWWRAKLAVIVGFSKLMRFSVPTCFNEIYACSDIWIYKKYIINIDVAEWLNHYGWRQYEFDMKTNV